MAEIYATTSSVPHKAGGRFCWGSVLAGLVAAMATMLVLTVLGLAVGLSSVDAGDRPSSFGIGAGIWGAVSGLISFFVGGWMASWSRADRGEGNGVLQGALTWMLGIVLLTYVLAGGVGTLAKTAGSAAATGVQAAGASAGAVANNAEVKQDAKAATQQAVSEVKEKAEEVRRQATPENVQKVSSAAAGGAWGTLAGLVITLAAAAGGGFVGAKSNKAVSKY